MGDHKNLLKLRKSIKRRKPRFTRQDSHKKGEIKAKWRRPKGIQSKMRLKIRGYKRSVSAGWGSPKKVRGLHSSGLKNEMVFSVKGLDQIDPKTAGITISGAVGQRKRLEIVKKAKELSIMVLNIKDTDKFLKDFEEKQKKTKEEKEKTKKTKETKKKEAKKKADEKEKEKEKEAAGAVDDALAEKIATEEKKSKEKEEKDKVLTKKQ